MTPNENDQKLENDLLSISIGESYTTATARLEEFTGDVGGCEHEGFGWFVEGTLKICFFKVIEVNREARTSTVKRLS